MLAKTRIPDRTSAVVRSEFCDIMHLMTHKALRIGGIRGGSRLLVDFKPEAHMLYIALGAIDGDVDCPPGFH